MEDIKEEIYAVIDLKSFYASCECAARGLDIFKTPLVVGDLSRTENSIIMSATPFLKEKYGVPNVCRIRDLPKIKDIIFATPRMQYYVNMSAKVVSVFLDFIDEEDLHVYSIDESFLHLTPYLKLYKCSAKEICLRIMKRIKDELGLIATCGMGPNMFLAKTCLDNEGKKKPPYIAHWHYEDVKTKLWKISPITKIWGISTGISSHLSRLGIRSLEGIVKAGIDVMEKEFGIMGKQLYEMASGIDHANIREKYIPKQKGLSIGQTLIKDYDLKGAKLILREMNDDLCFRMRLGSYKTNVVSVYCGYAASLGGFSRQAALNIPTDDNKTLLEAIYSLFDQYAMDLPIRGLGISFGGLKEYNYQQLNLFEDFRSTVKRGNLQKTIDEIQKIYGKNALLRVSALKEDSTAKERHNQIGGHRA